jgi:hypothetical protein
VKKKYYLALFSIILSSCSPKTVTGEISYSLFTSVKAFEFESKLSKDSALKLLEDSYDIYNTKTNINVNIMTYDYKTKVLIEEENVSLDSNILFPKISFEEIKYENTTIIAHNQIHCSYEYCHTYNVLTKDLVKVEDINRPYIKLGIVESGTPYSDIRGTTDFNNFAAGVLSLKENLIQFKNKRTNKTIRSIIDESNNYVFDSKDEIKDKQRIIVDRMFDYNSDFIYYDWVDGIEDVS